MRPAVFFDRDGTLIEPVHYLNQPQQVALIDGAAATLRALGEAGFGRILVTNQAAIDKGLLSVEGLFEIQRRLDRLLAAEGAALDAWYYSPRERLSDSDEIVDYADRKPGPGLLLRAAAEHGLDLGASWMVGDRLSDALAGRNAGCRGTILVETGHFRAAWRDHAGVDHVVSRIADILPIILDNNPASPPAPPPSPKST